ncbi:MAG TPA: class I SAM-dependent methyltransferase [Burkholderiales bacterium]|nr:class I SAM-dependent methyltransferase [Burkholderiales bacterium]
MAGLGDFLNRVRKNARHWGRWARRRGVTCYRVYDRDIPEFAFALDVYGERAQLQEYDRRDAQAAGHEDRLRQVHLTAAEGLDLAPERVALKRRALRRAGEQHEKTGRRGEDFVVEEGGHRFLVNLEAYLDTGLFLDHRNTRALVAGEAPGRRFLNLFCYTGSFTVYAAAGGAASSVSVDLSNTYLDWARRNFALNRIDGRRHLLERADARRWLEQAAETGMRFDLIVLDPPAFSASKAMSGVLDVQRDYPALLSGCARLLSDGGVLYFSTNLRTFKFDASAALPMTAEEISARTVPEDFRNRRVHRCWRMVRRA